MLGIVGGQVWLHVKLNEDKLVTRQVDPQVNDATLDPEVTTVNDTNVTATTEEPLTAEGLYFSQNVFSFTSHQLY